jgi:uncharacterized protein (TIGR03435 family)
MYAIIKPIKTVTSAALRRPGHVTADGVPLQVLVWLAYQTDSFHLDWQMPADKGYYRAAFRVPDDRKDRLFPYMRQTLTEMFGIQAHWVEQPRDVYVLRRVEGREPLAESRADKEALQMLRGKVTLRHQPITKVSEILTNVFGTMVVDETRLEGRYDFDFPYQPGQPEVTSKALRGIGLEAVKARRNVRVLVVQPEQTGQQSNP